MITLARPGARVSADSSIAPSFKCTKPLLCPFGSYHIRWVAAPMANCILHELFDLEGDNKGRSSFLPHHKLLACGGWAEKLAA